MGGCCLLLPWGGGEGGLLCRKCEYGKMLLEEWVVFQVEKWGSPLWDNTEWIQLFKITLCKYLSVNSF